jgi:hypothetical protein
MFGKPLSEYVAFEKPVLILIAAVWALRLLFSMAGIPVVAAKIVSISWVLVLASLYYGWAVGQKGFGSYKQLYGLNLVQGLFSQTLVALAIVFAMVIGKDNIYTIPEFYPPSAGNDPLGLPPDGKNLGHAIAHIVVAGAIVGPLVGWLLSSIVHFFTRKSARPATA